MVIKKKSARGKTLSGCWWSLFNLNYSKSFIGLSNRLIIREIVQILNDNELTINSVSIKCAICAIKYEHKMCDCFSGNIDAFMNNTFSGGKQSISISFFRLCISFEHRLNTPHTFLLCTIFDSERRQYLTHFSKLNRHWLWLIWEGCKNIFRILCMTIATHTQTRYSKDTILGL